jgi:hypothetical protein
VATDTLGIKRSQLTQPAADAADNRGREKVHSRKDPDAFDRWQTHARQAADSLPKTELACLLAYRTG